LPSALASLTSLRSMVRRFGVPFFLPLPTVFGEPFGLLMAYI